MPPPAWNKFLRKVISTESEVNTLHFLPLRTKIALAPPIFELDLYFFLQMKIESKFKFFAWILGSLDYDFNKKTSSAFGKCKIVINFEAKNELPSQH